MKQKQCYCISQIDRLSLLNLNFLIDERSRELYWEGQKRTHEVRFGKYTTGPGVANKAATTVLFPIPSDAVLSNPNLKQNAGY